MRVPSPRGRRSASPLRCLAVGGEWRHGSRPHAAGPVTRLYHWGRAWQVSRECLGLQALRSRGGGRTMKGWLGSGELVLGEQGSGGGWLHILAVGARWRDLVARFGALEDEGREGVLFDGVGGGAFGGG